MNQADTTQRATAAARNVTVDALRRTVSELVRAGTLPREAARAVVAAYGTGAPCDICAQPTTASGVTYTMRLGSGAAARSAYMHSACFEMWDEIRRLPHEAAGDPQ